MVFFFQAEDGIRDGTVTGVQTCALPILRPAAVSHGERSPHETGSRRCRPGAGRRSATLYPSLPADAARRKIVMSDDRRATKLGARFDQAFRFAAEKHATQTRKRTPVPYLSHLMSVAALVLEAGGDEDQAIAALLHDVVEDQGGLPTLATIRHMVGDRMANTVESCSDSTAANPSEKLPWRERKDKLSRAPAKCERRRAT